MNRLLSRPLIGMLAALLFCSLAAAWRGLWRMPTTLRSSPNSTSLGLQPLSAPLPARNAGGRRIGDISAPRRRLSSHAAGNRQG